MTKTATRSAPDPTRRRRAEDGATEVAAWKRSGQTADHLSRSLQKRVVVNCTSLVPSDQSAAMPANYDFTLRRP